MIRGLEKYIGHTVEIIYIDRENNITQRKVGIRHVQDHTINVYCHHQKAHRMFKVENILAMKPVGRRFG